MAGLFRAGIQLCQRNSFRLEDLKSEILWFTLLDTIMIPQRTLLGTYSNEVPKKDNPKKDNKKNKLTQSQFETLKNGKFIIYFFNNSSIQF